MRKVLAFCVILCLAVTLLAAGEGKRFLPADREPAAETMPEPAPEATPQPAPEPTPEPTPEPVSFAGALVPADTEELKLVLQEGETALLDRLPCLRRLDAEGSSCYEELCAWALEHPEVTVRYTLPIPGLGPVECGTERLDLRGLSPEELEEAAALLPYMPALRGLSLPGEEQGLPREQALEIAGSAPQALVDYDFRLYGQEVNLSDSELILFHIPVEDQGEAVRQVLPCMRACTWVDMDSCGVDNEHMAVIRDENPNVEVIWRVWFGRNYSVRTNVTKILASMPSNGGLIKNDNCEGLYYCTKVRYLDLGHNEPLTDFGFVRNMPDLEVVVISMAKFTDLSPFSSCSHLLYLEMGYTKVADLSPLAACTELRHLNIGTNIDITDISPLYDLPLKRLWIGSYTPVPPEQVARMQELHPDCEINTTVPSGLERDEDGFILNEGYVIGWKSLQGPQWDGDHARPTGYYKVVYKCFHYDRWVNAYAFSWNDPKCWGDDPFVKPVNVEVVDTSFLKEDWDRDAQEGPDYLEDPPGQVLYEFEH